MFNLQKELKKLDDIKNNEEKNIFVVNLLNSLDYKKRITIINNIYNIEQSKYNRLNKIKEFYEEKGKIKKLMEIKLKLDDQKNFCMNLKNLKKIVKKDYFIYIELKEDYINSIDNLMEENTIELINKLNDLKSSSSRLEILNQLKEIYENAINKLQTNRFYGKKQKIKLIKMLKKYIDNIIKNRIYMKESILLRVVKNKEEVEKKEKNIKEENDTINLPLTKEQIENIDQFINQNTYSLIVKLDSLDSSSSKLELLNKIKEIYEKSLSNLKGMDTENIYGQIRLIKIMRNYINNLIKIEHKIQNKNKKKIIIEEIDKPLTNNQKTIVNAMKNNSDISCYKTNDILIAYKEFITLFAKTYPKEVLIYAKYISNKLVSDVVDYDNIIKSISLIRDTIKNRLLSLDKNNEENLEERKILKEIRIVFDFISKNYREDLSKTKHDYCYDVINYFLQDESGYPYIKRIINDLPNIVNTKNNDEHILIILLSEFIYNHKKMLDDKTSSYINPDYLKQVYILFSNSIYLKLSKKEKDEIDTILNNYINYLLENVNKVERQKEIKKELYSLKTNNYFINKKPKLKNVDKSQFMWQANHIVNNRNNSINRNYRVNILEPTICFNNNTAYSIQEIEDKKIIKIHSLDVECMIPESTSIDSQVYNDMILNNDIHYQISRHLIFDYENLNPTITYELTFDKFNNVVDFKIYKSNIKNIKKCNDVDLFYMSNETLKKLATLSKKILLVKNISFKYVDINQIEKVMTLILNEQFIEYINKNNIPFIYGGIEYINDYINNMNNLSAIFSRLEKNEFQVIYQLINNNVGEYGYSKEMFEVENDYDLNLINKINYLSIFNQRLIDDIIINNELIKSKEDYMKKIEELEHNLNLSINHIRPQDMVYKNNRKRNKLKEYNL